jgi:putative lipoprotein
VDGVGPGEVLSSDLTFESERRVAGTSGCNRYVAQLNPSEPLVRIGEPTVTRMTCDPPLMEQERRFLNALNFTTRYRVDGDEMFFHDRTGRIVIRFMRRPPRPNGFPR